MKDNADILVEAIIAENQQLKRQLLIARALLMDAAGQMDDGEYPGELYFTINKFLMGTEPN